MGLCHPLAHVEFEFPAPPISSYAPQLKQTGFRHHGLERDWDKLATGARQGDFHRGKLFEFMRHIFDHGSGFAPGVALGAVVGLGLTAPYYAEPYY